MRVVGAFERFGRMVLVFEDGSMGKVVGFKRFDAKKTDPPGEPVLLMRPPLTMVGEVPEGWRVSQITPKLWPETDEGPKSKTQMDVEGD